MSHGGMTAETAKEYELYLENFMRCSCLTKTNDAMYHAAHCTYRIWTVKTYGTVVNVKRC